MAPLEMRILASVLTEAEMTPLPWESEGNLTSLCEEETGSEFSAAPFYTTASLPSDFTRLLELAASRLEIALLPPFPQFQMWI
jgi:hypothetical protein